MRISFVWPPSPEMMSTQHFVSRFHSLGVSLHNPARDTAKLDAAKSEHTVGKLVKNVIFWHLYFSILETVLCAVLLQRRSDTVKMPPVRTVTPSGLGSM